MKNTVKSANSGHRRIVYMTEIAVLIAIILIMGIFIPSVGYIPIGALRISLITIPVAIGGIVLGPSAGAILGLVFGLTSFYQCFGMDPFGAALLNINPIFTFIVCIGPRVLSGWIGALIYKGFIKIDKTKAISYFIGGLSVPLLNTILFMSTLLLCFYQTDYIQSIKASMGSTNIFAFLVAFVGINGALEWPLGCIIGGAVSKALDAAAGKNRRKNNDTCN